ncbi:YtfJ family protein, partial [Escherichia coli]|uniref:YtfJ family protein n=1 Tax=Escherichia coli TaxID=562 RepID=UPI00234CBACA
MTCISEEGNTRTLRKIRASTGRLGPMMASGQQVETGQRVAPIGITDRGELVLDKDQVSYKTWN